MLVSTSQRLAILAMPKTGSTAIEEVLAPRCEVHVGGDPRLKHMPLSRFERFVRPLLDACGQTGVETVCLFRDPLDWLLSWYRYRRRPCIPEPRNSTSHISFEAFVEGYLSPDPPAFAQVGRPARFVSGKDGAPAIDHIFRYESFAAFTRFISERFGEDLAFPRRNVSPREKIDVSTTLRRRVEIGMPEECRIHCDIAR